MKMLEETKCLKGIGCAISCAEYVKTYLNEYKDAMTEDGVTNGMDDVQKLCDYIDEILSNLKCDESIMNDVIKSLKGEVIHRSIQIKANKAERKKHD